MQPILRGQIWTVISNRQQFDVLIISNDEFNRSSRYDYYQVIPLHEPKYAPDNSGGTRIYGKVAMVELISTIRAYELSKRRQSASSHHLQQVEKDLIEQLGISQN